MKALTIQELYTLDETIAAEIFEGAVYPWEVLSKIHDFILKLGETLPEEEYDRVGEDVWIAKSAIYLNRLIFMDQPLSRKMQKFGMARLFGEMQL